MDRTAAKFSVTNVYPQWAHFSSWIALIENLKPKMYAKGNCQEMNEQAKGSLGEMLLSQDFWYMLCVPLTCVISQQCIYQSGLFVEKDTRGLKL